MNRTQNPPRETAAATPARTLREAAAYLRWAGLHQGDYYTDADTPTPPACAVGAIAIAVYGRPVASPHCDDPALGRHVIAAENALSDYLTLTGLIVKPTRFDDGDQDCGNESVYDWNDETGRTAADVITVLRAAADACTPNPGGAL